MKLPKNKIINILIIKRPLYEIYKKASKLFIYLLFYFEEISYLFFRFSKIATFARISGNIFLITFAFILILHFGYGNLNLKNDFNL